MSYAEKPEDITKEEWMDKLNNVHIQRADMNRLIMNYLVTGEALVCKCGTNQIQCCFVLLVCSCSIDMPRITRILRGIQRGSREVSNGVWN